MSENDVYRSLSEPCVVPNSTVPSFGHNFKMTKRTLSCIAAILVVIAMTTLVTIHATRKDLYREHHDGIPSVAAGTASRGKRWEGFRSATLNVLRSNVGSRAELPPLEVGTESLEECVVFLATLCTIIPFGGCEECKQRIADLSVAPKDAEYVLETTCYMLLHSSICAHFESLAACHMCKVMYPDGAPRPTHVQ